MYKRQLQITLNDLNKCHYDEQVELSTHSEARNKPVSDSTLLEKNPRTMNVKTKQAVMIEI